jgi:hypothetical protein
MAEVGEGGETREEGGAYRAGRGEGERWFGDGRGRRARGRERERFWGEGDDRWGPRGGGVAVAANYRMHHARGEWAGRGLGCQVGGGQAAPWGGSRLSHGEKPAQRGGEEGISLFQFLPIIYFISNLLLSANFMETKRIHPKVN